MRRSHFTLAALSAAAFALLAGGGSTSVERPHLLPPETPAVSEEVGEGGSQDLVVLQETLRGGLEVVTETVPGGQVSSRLAQLRAEEGVLAADVEGEVQTMEVGEGDPYRGRQWALDRLRAEEVWEWSSGEGVRVAVVDTGVDRSHEDLQGRVAVGWEGFDGEGSGFDPDGHGTHVAGVIAAVADNGVGVAGFAPGVEVVPVRVLDETGRGSMSGVAAGVLWAVEEGVEVINLSLGSVEDSDVLRTAVEVAVDAGVVVVAASGNEGMAGGGVLYPGAYPGVVTVSATTSGDTGALFSSSGEQVDLAAPGMGVLSTVPGGYEVRSGTSMAAPFVAASVAVLLSEGWDGASAVAGLEREASPLGERERFGSGLVFPLAVLDPGVEDDRGGPGCLLWCAGEGGERFPRPDLGAGGSVGVVWSSVTPRFPRAGEEVVVSGRLLPGGRWGGELSARVEQLDGDGELVQVLDEGVAGEAGEVQLRFVVEEEVRFQLRFVGDDVDVTGFVTVLAPAPGVWEEMEAGELPSVSWGQVGTRS